LAQIIHFPYTASKYSINVLSTYLAVTKPQDKISIR
jgi:hypothetical protein